MIVGGKNVACCVSVLVTINFHHERFDRRAADRGDDLLLMFRIDPRAEKNPTNGFLSAITDFSDAAKYAPFSLVRSVVLLLRENPDCGVAGGARMARYQ
jgi:hypothetical protein